MILLFGGGGQLGQELSHGAAARKIALKSLSRAEADISDRERVTDAIRHFKPDLVINAAAYTNVDLAEDDFDAALVANAHGPAVVAEVCRAAGVPLIHLSTDYVFDGTKTGAYVETDPVKPSGAYGRSKAIGEDSIRSAQPMHLIFRTGWVYGAFGKNFLKTMLRRANEEPEIRVVADQRGNPTSTLQITEAIFSIVPRALDGTCRWGTYHLAGYGITTWYDFASKIVLIQSRYTNKFPTVIPITSAEYPTAAKRPSNSSLDCSLVCETFGISLKVWSDECERVIDALMQS